MNKPNKNHKIRKKISLITIFALLFVLYYYLFFSWNSWLWFLLVVKMDIPNLTNLLRDYRVYADTFGYVTRIILATIAFSLTIYYYNKSSDKKKFWKWYSIYLSIFILLTLISLIPFGAV